jgi:hypothetical protein
MRLQEMRMLGIFFLALTEPVYREYSPLRHWAR